MAGEREMIHERKIHREHFSLVEGVGWGGGGGDVWIVDMTGDRKRWNVAYSEMWNC